MKPIATIHGALILAVRAVSGAGIAATAARADTNIFARPCASNPYSLNAAQREDCGYNSVPLMEVHATAYGGEAYVYAEGAETAIIPPESFNPVTATEEERHAFGIPPPPPKESARYAAWHEDLANLHFPTPPAELIQSSTPHSEEKPSNNWSGYTAAPSGGGDVQATQVEYTEPESDSAACSNFNEADFWTGINTPEHGLIQLGTEVGTLDPDDAGRAWWEMLTPAADEHTLHGIEASEPFFFWEGPDTEEVNPLTVAEGQHVLAFVSQTWDDDDDATFFLETGGRAYSMLASNYGEAVLRKRADFIVESNAEVTAFSPITMTGTADVGGYWYEPREWALEHPRLQRLEGIENILARSEEIFDPNDFTTTWRQCGEEGPGGKGEVTGQLEVTLSEELEEIFGW